MLPSIPLRNYIRHYFLSRDNSQEIFSALPDGAVDLVIRVDGRTSQDLVYGSSTQRFDVPLAQGSHYLGIRFRPGQSRHFLKVAAVELTNTFESAKELCKFDLYGMPELVEGHGVFAKLNAILEKFIQIHPPIHSRIDNAILDIELSNGIVSIAETAAIYGKSVRQFERVFRETVGVSPKLFSEITRFHQASMLITTGTLSLVQVAADMGYTDQSHMSREFRRFTNLPPISYMRSDVAFLQDQFHKLDDNCVSQLIFI